MNTPGDRLEIGDAYAVGDAYALARKPMKMPKIPTKAMGLPKISSKLDLEDLRWKRDRSARNGDLKTALACAIAIDKKRGLYGSPKRKRVNKS